MITVVLWRVRDMIVDVLKGYNKKNLNNGRNNNGSNNK
jgi:hypothetical protein